MSPSCLTDSKDKRSWGSGVNVQEALIYTCGSRADLSVNPVQSGFIVHLLLTKLRHGKINERQKRRKTLDLACD